MLVEPTQAERRLEEASARDMYDRGWRLTAATTLTPPNGGALGKASYTYTKATGTVN